MADIRNAQAALADAIATALRIEGEATQAGAADLAHEVKSLRDELETVEHELERVRVEGGL